MDDVEDGDDDGQADDGNDRPFVALGCSILAVYTLGVFVIGLLVGVWYGIRVFADSRDNEEPPELVVSDDGPWPSSGSLIDDTDLIEEARDDWLSATDGTTDDTSGVATLIVLWAGVVADKTTVVLGESTGPTHATLGDVLLLQESQGDFEHTATVSFGDWYPSGPIPVGPDLERADHLLMHPDVKGVVTHRFNEDQLQSDEMEIVDYVIERRSNESMCEGVAHEIRTDNIDASTHLLLDIKPSESHGRLLTDVGVVEPEDVPTLARAFLSPEACGGDERGAAQGVTLFAPDSASIGDSSILELTVDASVDVAGGDLPTGSLFSGIWTAEVGVIEDSDDMATEDDDKVVVWVPESGDERVEWLAPTGTPRVWSLDLPETGHVLVVSAPRGDAVVAPEDRVLAHLPSTSHGHERSLILLDDTGPETTVRDDTGELTIEEGR